MATKSMLVGGALLALAACGQPAQAAQPGVTFGQDLARLKQHTDVVVLSDASGQAQVAVVPRYQGRVMTSTAGGPGGASFGWLNDKLIKSGQRQEHFNAFGGEDRFWLGPEGGQFALFFAPRAPFDMAHWETPTPVDWGGWVATRKTRSRIAFQKDMALTNRSGTRLNVRVNREVRLLTPGQIATAVGGKLSPRIHAVGFESVNTITNRGGRAWTRATGMPSIWILGQFNPSPQTTIVAPFKPGPIATRGRIVNDAYFGKVPADRLVVKADKGVLFFKADGLHRSKIGLSPQRAKPLIGSYDAAHHVLTLVQPTLPSSAPTGYVNSMWEVQKAPFGGDAINSYNDGPLATGGQLGPFYELESSSPAAALRPGASLTHVHRTIHLQGPPSDLEGIARRTLGVGLGEITHAFTAAP